MSKNDKALKLAEIQKDSTQYVELVKSLKITTAESLVEATELVTTLMGRSKRIEELRLFFTKPLNDQVTNINQEFKATKAPFLEMINIIKGKVLDYRRIEEAKLEKIRKRKEEQAKKKFEKEQEKARIKAEKEAEKERLALESQDLSKKDEKKALKEIEDDKNSKVDEASQEEFSFNDSDFQQSKNVHSNSGSINVKKVWKFKVIDPNKVPKQYLIVDEKIIRRDVRAGVRSIDGVEIYEEENVGVKA